MDAPRAHYRAKLRGSEKITSILLQKKAIVNDGFFDLYLQ